MCWTGIMRRHGLCLVPVLALLGADHTAGQTLPNPGAFVSSQRAGQTTGLNLLFFGNSYTISSQNSAVHTPSYAGARGIPELVRRVAIAAGQVPPFVKNVYERNKGFDYHLNAASPSLSEIDEPALDHEAWDFVVLQGFSTRPTHHPYTGNARLHQENAWRLFEEVRAGTTRHISQHPAVTPVLYQTWARHPDHWFYDLTSPHNSGNNIAIGLSNWTGGRLFTGPAQMAEEVRTSHDEARQLIDARTPQTTALVTPVGDAWQAGDWGRGSAGLYAWDYYHANSRGDLLTAMTIYGTIYDDADTSRIVASGALQSTLSALGVSAADATQLAAWADQALRNTPVPQPPQWPASAVLVDFSTLVGPLVGAEQRPVPGRHYNTITDRVAGRVDDSVDTENRPTGIDIVIVDDFAGQTSAGATGSFISAVNIDGSLYDFRAQRDSFFVGRGSGYSDPQARVELRGLDPAARYDLVLHGSRESTSQPRIAHFTVQGASASVMKTLDAAHNLNLVAMFSDLAPDATGTIGIDITNGGRSAGFAYLGVLELRTSARLSGGRTPAAGETLELVLAAPAHAGKVAVTATSLGLGPILYGPHLIRLDPDALFSATFGLAGSPIFTGYIGILDAAGRTRPSINLPLIPGLEGLALHTASVIADPTAPGGVTATSNTWSMRVR